MSNPYTLVRVKVGRTLYVHQIQDAAGMQYGPNLGDSNGPREAAPWLAALGDAYRAGQVAENLRLTGVPELRAEPAAEPAPSAPAAPAPSAMQSRANGLAADARRRYGIR